MLIKTLLIKNAVDVYHTVWQFHTKSPITMIKHKFIHLFTTVQFHASLSQIFPLLSVFVSLNQRPEVGHT